jgi:organic hydroperoxide reductase OsmC/OhrA
MRAKEFSFPLSVEWLEGPRAVVRVEGKQEIEIASPPVFHGTDPSVWSPEDLFVAAAASCLAVTLNSIAARHGLPLHAAEVTADGTVSYRDDGRFGFTRLELGLSIETDAGREELAREVARKAEEDCLVTVSLDCPVELEIEVSGRPAQ